jgi:DNA ligase (NAD+)
VIRSGDVIPKIINVVLPSSELGLCSNCPSCDSELGWNKTKVELVCPNELCDEKVISQNVEFFKVMGVEEVGEGVVKQLYDAGYRNIPMIISTSEGEFENIDGFGERKAEIVYSQIHSKLKDVPIYTLQHASNLFKGLGERKLKLLDKYDSLDKKPQLSEVLLIDGYSNKTANVYLDAFDNFWDYYETIKGFVSIKEYVPPVIGVLSGKTFVFTGGKPKSLIDLILSLGGKEGTSVSGKVFAVIAKDKGGGSSKEKKAIDLGVNLWNWEELRNFLGEDNES